MIYNPSLRSPDDLKRTFIVRQSELDTLLATIEAAGPSPQHVLIIGSRGMGKTTLLYRLACAIEENSSLRPRWLPIFFDEEQYNIGEIADFWLNCLEVIADSTGDEGLYRQVDRLQESFEGRELEEATLRLLEDISVRQGRRLLLCVDNVDVVLARLGENTVAHRLRDVLQHQAWLMMVGAASSPIEATYDYDKPFYDFFRIIELQPLDRSEAARLLLELGEIRGRTDVIRNLVDERADILDILSLLMGGNVRTVTTLFDILTEVPGANFENLLNSLLDRHTVFFKDRIEALAPLGQRVFDSLAHHWDPATADQIAEEIRVDRGVASAQLHRLYQRGLVQKINLPERAIGYQVAERFFNVWCLMRGRRRNRQKLRSLVRFLEIFLLSSEPVTDFDRLVARLMRFDLMDEYLVDEIDGRARELNKPTSGQEVIPSFELNNNTTRSGGSRRESKLQVLALCKLGRFQEADRGVDFLLKLESPSSSLPHLVRSYCLEQQDSLGDVPEMLRQGLEKGAPQILALEQSRVLAKLGRTMEASAALFTYASSKEISGASFASSVVEIADADGEEMTLLARTVLGNVLQLEPGNEEAHFAACELDLRLGRFGQALEQLRLAAAPNAVQSSSEKLRRVLGGVLEISAANRVNEALAFLEETGLAERWLPLTHALMHLGGQDEVRLQRLAPEMRSFTEMVEVRIEKLRKLRAATSFASASEKSAARPPQSSSLRSR